MNVYTDLKQSILNTATKLFYEKGFKVTKLSDIANEIGISKSIISYHFGSKVNLGNQVFTDYIQKIKDKVAENFRSDDIRMVMAISDRKMMSMYQQDIKAFQFYCEYIETALFNHNLHDNTFYYRHYDRYKFKANLKEDELNVLHYAADAAKASIINAYFSGAIKSSYEFIVNYIIYLDLLFTKVDEKTISKILKDSLEIADSIKITVKPYFQIE